MPLRWDGLFHTNQFEENEPEWRGYKECSRCREVRPRLEFYRMVETPDRLSYLCRPCVRSAEAAKRGAKYGITNKRIAEMMNEQGGKCAICQRVVGMKLKVDHDHKNLKVRGMLCGRCNVGLGFFQDNIITLTAAIEYLKRTSFPGEGNGQAS